MKLTESQINTREELFYDLLEFIINEEYEYDEEYEITNEDAIAAEEMMQYFVEQYKEPSLKENINEAMTGYGINEELYLEIIETILLDESIGGFLAGAVHGVGNYLANRKAEKTKAASKEAGVISKATGRASRNIERRKGSDVGIEKVKKLYLKGKDERAKAEVINAAAAKSGAAKAAKAKGKQRTALANRIDTKIADTKTAVKNKAFDTASAIKNKATDTASMVKNKAMDTSNAIKNKAADVKTGAMNKGTNFLHKVARFAGRTLYKY